MPADAIDEPVVQLIQRQRLVDEARDLALRALGSPGEFPHDQRIVAPAGRRVNPQIAGGTADSNPSVSALAAPVSLGWRGRVGRPIVSFVGDAPRQSIAEALERQTVVWVSSVRPDGTPHLLPLWFVWDGDSILVFSKPHAQKVRNVQASPRVMVAVGEPDADWDVELVEGVAELVAPAAKGELPDSFAAKYRDLMARAGTTGEEFAQTYSQPIRIRPTRWLNYGGAGWRAGEQAAAA
jgi:PPOX class probable F420-dependent enzyme